MSAVKGQHRKVDTSKLTPALLIALFQKPQDRHFIIELENDFLGFIESASTTYQLKPMNSYYRLLTHQLAEYHGLLHTVAKERDKCVIVYKEDGFQGSQTDGSNGRNEGVGALILLQDLDPSIMYHFPPQYFTMAAMAAMNNILSSAAGKAKYQHQKSSPYLGGMYNIADNNRVPPTRRGKQFTSAFWADRGLQKENNDIYGKSASVIDRGPSTSTSSNSSAIQLLQDRTTSSATQENGVDEGHDTSRSTSQESEEHEPIEDIQEASPQPHEFETSRYKFVKGPSKLRSSGVSHAVLSDKTKESSDNGVPLNKSRWTQNKGRKRSKAPNTFTSYDNRKNKSSQNSNGLSLQPTGNMIPFQKSRPPKYPQGYYYHTGQHILTYAAVPSPMMDYSFVQTPAMNGFGLQNCYPGYPVQQMPALTNGGSNSTMTYYSNGSNHNTFKGNAKSSFVVDSAEYFSDRKLNSTASVHEKGGKYSQTVIKDSKK